MSIQALDGLGLTQMILAGAALLEANVAHLNALNVFPVPDGDTGTNMSLTLSAVVRELSALDDQAGTDVVSAAVARGSLRGARGNSGVILSQLFRGFSKAMTDKAMMDAAHFASAVQSGVEMAYKAVMKPKEGTILTVARAMADTAKRAARSGLDVLGVLDAMLEQGQITLDKTPDMLPVLKQAGVVDAGGKGLLLIYTGFRYSILGQPLPEGAAVEKQREIEVESTANEVAEFKSLADIKFGYCTEFFVVRLKEGVGEAQQDDLRDKLGAIGDSIVVVGDPEMIKVHVHTNNPGQALQYALELGELGPVKIENMREQHREIMRKQGRPVDEDAAPAAQEKEVALVSVSVGEGIGSIFNDLGVDRLIEGGQSMNPSIEDIARAVEETNAKTVFVLPNNSNIILAAQQVKDILPDRRVEVIPSKSIPQGISAILAFNLDSSVEENVERMTDALASAHCAQITYAVRDTENGEFTIKKDDILGLFDSQIQIVGNDVDTVVKDLLAKCIGDCEIVTGFYGEDVSEQAAGALRDALEEQFPDCDIEMHFGGQPLYHYIFSVE